MKKLTLILLSVLMTVTLAACGNKCVHTYDNACDATCKTCGETREVSAHQWNDATCTTLKTCTVCGTTEGEMLPHNWEDATCITAKTCKTCGATEGEALGHTPAEDDGDCTTPVKCKNCNQIAVSGNQTHTYGTITYTWADDYSSCTAMRKCTVNGCQSTETETKAATQDGEIFTVDFDNEAFETQRGDTSVQIGNVTVNPWNEAPLIDAGEAEEQYGKENEQ